MAFSSAKGSLHSSLWQSKDNISFDCWRISYHFIQAGITLSKIQIQVRMWLVHPQKDRACFRYKFEGDINNAQLFMPTTVTIPGEETSYRILIKSEIKSEHKTLLSSVLFTAARKSMSSHIVWWLLLYRDHWQTKERILPRHTMVNL